MMFWLREPDWPFEAACRRPTGRPMVRVVFKSCSLDDVLDFGEAKGVALSLCRPVSRSPDIGTPETP
jgi:hypothetical protein